MLQAIQDKVFSLMAPQDEEESDEEEDVDEDGDVEADMIAHQGEDIDIDEDKVSTNIDH